MPEPGGFGPHVELVDPVLVEHEQRQRRGVRGLGDPHLAVRDEDALHPSIDFVLGVHGRRDGGSGGQPGAEQHVGGIRGVRRVGPAQEDSVSVPGSDVRHATSLLPRGSSPLAPVRGSAARVKDEVTAVRLRTGPR